MKKFHVEIFPHPDGFRLEMREVQKTGRFTLDLWTGAANGFVLNIRTLFVIADYLVMTPYDVEIVRS